MTPLFKKMNLGAVKTIHVLNAPESFEVQLATLDDVNVSREPSGRVLFALAFVRTLNEVAAAAEQLTHALDGDAMLWMAYPKASSKKYNCEFNRDTGWAALGQLGYEPVRQIAIDDDWSALRFRKAEFIKAMTRHPDGAISEVGRQKARAQREA